MRRGRGTSLPEAILAIFLLLLIVILITNLFPTALASVRLSGQRLQAEGLAESLLARELERPFHQLAIGPPVAQPAVRGHGTIFSSEVEVFASPDAAVDPQRLRGIRVRVRWDGREIRREVLRADVLR